jgi:hypothetical protein
MLQFQTSIKLQAKYNSKAPIFPLLICGEFDAELKIQYARMALKGPQVLQPFFAFCVQFVTTMAHNMLMLMLHLDTMG